MLAVKKSSCPRDRMIGWRTYAVAPGYAAAMGSDRHSRIGSPEVCLGWNAIPSGEPLVCSRRALSRSGHMTGV